MTLPGHFYFRYLAVSGGTSAPAPSTKGDFMAQGILGQYIYVNPSDNLVIVRLGRNRGSVEWREVFQIIASR